MTFVRVHDEGSERGFTTEVHDGGFTTEVSRRRFRTKVHDEGSEPGDPIADTVRSGLAGRMGAISELRDGRLFEKRPRSGSHRRRPGFVSGVRQTPLPNRLGADHRISQAGDAS